MKYLLVFFLAIAITIVSYKNWENRYWLRVIENQHEMIGFNLKNTLARHASIEATLSYHDFVGVICQNRWKECYCDTNKKR